MRTTFHAAAVLLLAAMLGPAARGGDWSPVEQPGLASALDAAPALKFEELAAGPDACWVGPIWWVPNPDGKTWDTVLFYYPTYPGPHQVVIYDFGTGKLERTGIGTISGARFRFHITPYFLMGGRLLIQPGVGSKDVAMFSYDPAENRLSFGGFPLGQNVVRGDGAIAANDDGTLLGGFGPSVTEPGRIGFYTIDPTTLAGDYLGTVGPENKNLFWEYRGAVMDGDWIYARVGNTPWRLFGMNVKTREGKVLAETGPIIGDHATIQLKVAPEHPGVYATIKGLAAGPRDAVTAFWLRDGKLTPCEPLAKNAKLVPPWQDERLAAPRVDVRRQEPKAPRGIEIRRMPPDLDGQVRVWYRLEGDMAAAAQVPAGEWRKFEFPVELFPTPIRRMAALPDGSLFAVSEGYSRAVRFHPQSGRRETLGPTMSVYSLCSHDGKVFMCGYPDSKLWVYDPARPWTVGRSTDLPPDQQPQDDDVAATPESNPAQVAMLKEFNHVHMPFGGAVPAADGRVYFGGKVIRIGNGGGLGWWDPAAREAGGFHEPFDSFTMFWMCSAADGRYVICSTKPVADDERPDFLPPRGRLFVYDTRTHEIVHEVDDERLTPSPGYVVEALPGLVMGYAPAGKDGPGVLYGFDPAAGKVLWTKPVPRPPETGFSAIRRWNYCFTKGPDGFIWATMKGVLTRIDPRTAEVHPVGKMPDAQVAFLGGDVYVAGGEKFRRLSGVSALPAATSEAPSP